MGDAFWRRTWRKVKHGINYVKDPSTCTTSTFNRQKERWNGARSGQWSSCQICVSITSFEKQKKEKRKKMSTRSGVCQEFVMAEGRVFKRLTHCITAAVNEGINGPVTWYILPLTALLLHGLYLCSGLTPAAQVWYCSLDSPITLRSVVYFSQFSPKIYIQQQYITVL